MERTAFTVHPSTAWISRSSLLKARRRMIFRVSLPTVNGLPTLDTFGKADVFVRRFMSQRAAPLKASTGGGHNPRWSHDGRHLFYRTDDWKLMTMSVSRTEQLHLGKPEMLMQLPQDAIFEISNDNRFLVSSPNGRLISPLMIVANWHPEAFESR